MCVRGTGSELRATGGAQAGPLRPAPALPGPVPPAGLRGEAAALGAGTRRAARSAEREPEPLPPPALQPTR